MLGLANKQNKARPVGLALFCLFFSFVYLFTFLLTPDYVMHLALCKELLHSRFVRSLRPSAT